MIPLMYDIENPIRLEIHSVTALIAAVGMTETVDSISFYCSEYSLNNFSTASTTRENNFLLQLEIAEKIAKEVGASFTVRKNENIDFDLNYDFIIDINAIRIKQFLPEKGRIKFLAVSPEGMNPLLFMKHIHSLGVLKSRWRCFQDLYLDNSIPFRVHSFLPSRHSKFIEINNILGPHFQPRIQRLAKNFSECGYSDEFSRIFTNLLDNPEIFFLIILPTPKHYGGTEEEDRLISRYVLSHYNPENTIILIKNHPSDLVRHSAYDIELSGFSLTNWYSSLSRNLPIELLTIPFQDRLCLISAGSSAQYSINPTSSRLVKSPDAYARKLYENIYGSLNTAFGITSF